MNDFEFIKSKFEQDGLDIPDSLNEERIIERLEKEAGEKDKGVVVPWYKRRVTRNFIPMVACLALVLLTLPVLQRMGVAPGRGVIQKEESPAVVEGVKTFKNRNELSRFVASKIDETGHFWENGGIKEALVKDAEMSVVSNDAENMGEEPPSHSNTYTQVNNVDEADIIKTDGKYIYYVDGYHDVVICKAENGKAEKVSTISQFDEEKTVQDMYLADDRLVTIGFDYQDRMKESVVTCYDIKNPEKPEKVGEFKQSGETVSSRLVGNTVYLVTNFFANKKVLIPIVTCNGRNKEVATKNLCSFPNPQNPCFVTVSAINFENGKKITSNTKAVLGGSDEIYCNTKSLYVTSRERKDTTLATKIFKIALNDGNLKLVAAGKVRGEVYGQFAMDEKDGYFRIATTANKNKEDVNNLYVLDKDLKQVGDVSGFARNEHIEAVRFVGNKAYVITYEQIDPLFILDLSDPAKPKIDGEVEITGFSTLLLPVSDKRLVGVGYGTSDNGYGGEKSDGLKIALFDISNPSAPKVLDSKQFENYESEAQTNHHALLENKGDKYFAVPYSVFQQEWIEDDVIVEDAEISNEKVIADESEKQGGVLVFSADDSIAIRKDFGVVEAGVRRCVYIGDYIYALDEIDNITGFKL